MSWLGIMVVVVRGLLLDRAELAAENLALRQQLAALHRQSKRPRLRKSDRIFWVLLSHILASWRSVVIIVQPNTVIRWHRRGFKLFWRWKSRGKPGSPKIDSEIRTLIRRMCRDNPI